jgi:hypothetical protein
MGLPGGLPVDVAPAPGKTVVAAAVYASQLLVTMTPDAVSYGNFDVTSVAYDPTDRLVGFVREPASFLVIDNGGFQEPVIPIQAPSVRDTGHDLFHHAADPKGGTLACASCHPEGRDDGRVWNFLPIGPRRTPSLVGGLLATAPFHWDGDLADMGSLMDEVFTRRMGGFQEDAPHVAAVARFLEAVPRVPIAPPRVTAAYQHGKELFESGDLGCTGCHSGPHLTNNATIDVNTEAGQPFQVPTLIGVGLRAPYLHNGCAATLTDRFGPCGGGDQHGHTSQLSAGDVSDLVEFLSSL